MKNSCLISLKYPDLGSLPIAVARALRQAGEKVFISFQADVPRIYAADPLQEFRDRGLLLDYRGKGPDETGELLAEVCAENNINTLVRANVRNSDLSLNKIKYKCPNLSIYDWMFDTYEGHFNHFLNEKAFNGIIVNSQFMYDFYEKNSSQISPNIHLIPNGIKLNGDTNLKPAPTEPESKRPLKVGFVGQLSEERNPLGFVDIVKQISQYLPNVNFTISGIGFEEYLIASRINLNGLGHKLHFLDPFDEMENALREIDVLLVPSKTDGRHSKVMKAAALGVPVIAAPVGSLPELVLEGVTGAILEPDDFEGIKNLLLKWSNDSAAFEKIRMAAHHHAEKNFNYDNMMNKYVELLQSVIHSAPKTA